MRIKEFEMLEGAKSMGAGAATIASAGAAVGIGNVFSSLIHSVARNPSLAKQSFGYAILGFALTEAIALFALMMAFLISFVFRSKRFQSHILNIRKPSLFLWSSYFRPSSGAFSFSIFTCVLMK